MKIVIFRVHKINIGEAIVTKGAIGCVKKAFPEADVMEVSLYPDKISNRIQEDSLLTNFRSITGFSTETTAGNHTRIVDLLDADLAVIPGGILRTGIDQFMRTFRILREKQIPIVLLGAGGNGSIEYTSSELYEKINNFFEELDVQVLITRDSLAYDAFSAEVEFSHDGIDCGFYINNWYDPPDASKEFSTIAFDKSKAPDIRTENTTIYPIHKPFDNPHWSLSRRIWSTIRGSDYGGVNVRKEMQSKDNVFISDNVREYLFLYANTTVTHTDRMHSCIPTLAYGGKARVYTNDLRRHIFDGLVDGNVLAEPVSTLDSKVKEKKAEQIKVLQESVEIIQS